MKIKLSMLGLLVVLFIVGCGETPYYGKVDNTPYATKECLKELASGAEIDHKNKIDKIVVYKKKRVLYAYKDGKVVETFRISLGANGGADAGNKVKAGDYRTPEGTYSIVRKKCDARLYRSLMISYPSEADKARARKRGLNPGGYITIHGQPKWNADGRGDEYTLSRDWTEGCMAVPNFAMDKLWAAVEKGVEIEIHA
ncbi:L,D-transpeptidase family protein [Sulfurovum sp. XTW-4]|uniref:L,D-transpeptidase family protein n=1 Tax=Sulfurovum xiamenensis TaxID=3019066 RepID=A0ABT7QRF9_9BACT|nr:L,D-transpeptidase family protein [Sulfurovum xiamenensis]MDM5263685.1 L,D-transpeptidase family protein [Sulfurovum xiamenensis]